jgi:prepilin-type N-terminal cleavage/methylation domain-containing protein
MGKHHNKGFTLVEIIVSIALLAIIALFMLPMSMYSVQYSKWNNIKLTAMNLAYTQVEWLKTLDYNTALGLDGIGYSPAGIVKENLYLNEPGSDPKTVEGVEYSLLTSIYWESAESSNGEFVANAIKKADVTIRARDPISGRSRSYAVIGTLIAFEGERTLSSYVPLKIRTVTGEDFTNPAKNVKVVVNNLSNTMVSWSRTDENGEAFFTELANAKYYIFPQEWEAGDMVARPTGTKGAANNEDWVYQVQVEVKATTADYLEQIFYVDHPAYIVLKGYPNALMSSTYVKLYPIYDPPEGDIGVYDLDTSLTGLLSKKLWRAWDYEHSIKNGADSYYFVETGSGNLWDGSFEYIEDKVTNKELKLAYGLKEGSFKLEADGSITLAVEFTSEISGIDTMLFSLYQDSTPVVYSDKLITQAVSGINNKFLINIKTNQSITAGTLRFVVDNKEAGTLINAHGMKLVQDRNYCSLIKK